MIRDISTKKFIPLISVLITALFACIPSVTFALNLSTPTSFKDIVCYVIGLAEIVDPILFFLAFIFFFWGLSKFIINSSGNEKELQTGKNYMMWGILALFILVTFQAIIGLVTNEFFSNGVTNAIPYLSGTGKAGAGCDFNPTSTSNVNFDMTNPGPVLN